MTCVTIPGLFGNSLMSDVEIRWMEGEKEVSVPAHKVILAASSTYFEKLFTTTMKRENFIKVANKWVYHCIIKMAYGLPTDVHSINDRSCLQTLVDAWDYYGMFEGQPEKIQIFNNNLETYCNAHWKDMVKENMDFLWLLCSEETKTLIISYIQEEIELDVSYKDYPVFDKLSEDYRIACYLRWGLINEILIKMRHRVTRDFIEKHCTLTPLQRSRIVYDIKNVFVQSLKPFRAMHIRYFGEIAGANREKNSIFIKPLFDYDFDVGSAIFCHNEHYRVDEVYYEKVLVKKVYRDICYQMILRGKDLPTSGSVYIRENL
jgi:hypothetical protein